MFLFDYLMPAEFFPSVFVGGGLLLWAALRMHVHVKLIVWSLGSAAVLLVGSQGLAVVTGLSTGKIAASGWQWALVLALIIGYALAVVLLGVCGTTLVRGMGKVIRQEGSTQASS